MMNGNREMQTWVSGFFVNVQYYTWEGEQW